MSDDEYCYNTLCCIYFILFILYAVILYVVSTMVSNMIFTRFFGTPVIPCAFLKYNLIVT